MCSHATSEPFRQAACNIICARGPKKGLVNSSSRSSDRTGLGNLGQPRGFDRNLARMFAPKPAPVSGTITRTFRAERAGQPDRRARGLLGSCHTVLVAVELRHAAGSMGACWLNMIRFA
jgi:hypothetical protein